jgi:hypothetical protein
MVVLSLAAMMGAVETEDNGDPTRGLEDADHGKSFNPSTYRE